MLAVVEDRQSLRPAKAVVQRRLATDDAHAGHDRVEHLARPLRGLEPDEPDGQVDKPVTRRDRDSGLADTAWADELDEPVPEQELVQSCDLAVAGHELC